MKNKTKKQEENVGLTIAILLIVWEFAISIMIYAYNKSLTETDSLMLFVDKTLSMPLQLLGMFVDLNHILADTTTVISILAFGLISGLFLIFVFIGAYFIADEIFK